MIVATVPILIVYALFQETLIENTVTGGLKG
jgi:ABC-type glycerol-3-phosphate transport system permease component